MYQVGMKLKYIPYDTSDENKDTIFTIERFDRDRGYFIVWKNTFEQDLNLWTSESYLSEKFRYYIVNNEEVVKCIK